MKLILKILVGALLLGLVLRSVELSALFEAFAAMRLQTMAVAIALFLLSCGVAAFKWRLLWRGASWWQMLIANFVSQFYSLILPGQLAGEVVKTLYMGRRFVDTAGVAASVLIDRVTGLIGLLLIACGGALLSDSAIANKAAVPLAIVTIGFILILYLAAAPSAPRVIESMFSHHVQRYSWLSKSIRAIASFLSSWTLMVSRLGNTLWVIALGASFQLILICINLTVAQALGISVSFFDWCWILGFIAVALLLPITVGGIGVREGTYVGLLGILGIPSEKAVALSVLVFATSLTGAGIGAVAQLVSPARDRTRTERF